MLWLFIVAALATEIETHSLDLPGAKLEFMIPVDAGVVAVKKNGDAPRFLVSAGYQSLMCDYVWGRGHAKKVWTAWADFFENAASAAAAQTTDEMTAKSGGLAAAGHGDTGWCNATAVTSGAEVKISFTQNRRCKSGDCEQQQLELVMKPSDATRAGRALRATADRL